MEVSIVGGGIAGSASAIALRRLGAEVTVYEAHEDPAGPVGSFVSLAVNGLRTLEALGCLDAVQQTGFPVARQRMWSGRGKLLGDVARGRRPEDTMFSVTLMRADLVRILRAAARREGAHIVTGQRVGPAGDLVVDPAGDLVVGPAGDLVVGADGIWSGTRQRLDAQAPKPTYAGVYSVSGVSDAARTAAGTPTDGFNWVFGRHGVFIYLAAPDGTIWWSAQVAAATPASGLTGIGPAELAETFRAEPVAVNVLAAATGVRAATAMHVLAPVRKRHDGRTVLVGDAAHPAGAGQGASMALEDAVVLAREVVAATTIPQALEAFDRVRAGRAGKLAKMEAANRDAKTAGPLGARMREVIMPFVFSRFYEKATGWLYDFDPTELA